MKRRLIINADDLGLCCAVNNAVCRSYREGVLTSASLMANGPQFTHAVEDVIRANPGLGVGVHLCLTSGTAVLPADEVPDLVRRDGTFRHSFGSLFRLLRHPAPGTLSQIEHELAAQIAKVVHAGVAIDHLDSHRHVHMIPPLFAIVVRLAQQWGHCAVRVSTEPWFPMARRLFTRHVLRIVQNVPKNLLLRTLSVGDARPRNLIYTDRVYGILGSGRMDLGALRAVLLHLPTGISEVLTHPAEPLHDRVQGVDPHDATFVASHNRQWELTALLDPDLKDLIRALSIELVTFSHLSPVAELD